jgi:hypothetical protein
MGGQISGGHKANFSEFLGVNQEIAPRGPVKLYQKEILCDDHNGIAIFVLKKISVIITTGIQKSKIDWHRWHCYFCVKNKSL